MAKIKVYLAGPMRGIEEFNFPLFLSAGANLEDEWDFEVFNPAQHDIDRGFDFSGYDGTEDLSDTGFDLRQSLGDDLEFVAREADLVVVLDGWEKSKGARAEVATALALGIPVVRYVDLEWSEGIEDAPAITEIPPLRDALWEPVSNHVPGPAVDIPCYIVSGKATGEGEDGPEFQEGDVVDVYSFSADRGEVRSVSSTGAEKGTKIERFDLLPTQALAKIARHYGVGAAKYAPNNWRKGYEWSKSYAAMMRHANEFWAGEDMDEETGCLHLASVIFHAMALMVFIDEQPHYDDRFKPNTEPPVLKLPETVLTPEQRKDIRENLEAFTEEMLNRNRIAVKRVD